MVNHILTGEPFSRKDMPKLAQLFEQSFDFYIQHNTPFLSDYLIALRTIVGLGFTAALADKRLCCVYQHHLRLFIAQDVRDFKNNKGAKRSIAQVLK